MQYIVVCKLTTPCKSSEKINEQTNWAESIVVYRSKKATIGWHYSYLTNGGFPFYWP